MTNKKGILGAVVVGWMLCLSMQASALLISLEPGSQSAAPGDSVVLDLIASDFGDLNGIGGFDIELSYDLSALIFDGYTLGSDLGELSLFEAVDYSFGDLGGGLINVAEVSFLDPVDLSALQGAGPITLATLDFTAGASAVGGSTLVDVSTVYSIADGLGAPITGVTTGGAEIRTVPVPATPMLIALGLLGLAVRRSASGIA